MNIRISVVIPVYNSQQSLLELHYRLSNVLRVALKECQDVYEIIFVDDASSDDSLLIARRLSKNDPRTKVYALGQNLGQQKAIMHGLTKAQGDVIITMDDDLQHPPEELPLLLDKLAEGYDLVFGIPQVKQHAWARKLGTKCADLVVTISGCKPAGLKISSYRALGKNVIEGLLKNIGKSQSDGFIYISAELLRQASRPCNVYIQHQARKYGKSNYDYFKLLRLLASLFRKYAAQHERV